MHLSQHKLCTRKMELGLERNLSRLSLSLYAHGWRTLTNEVTSNTYFRGVGWRVVRGCSEGQYATFKREWFGLLRVCEFLINFPFWLFGGEGFAGGKTSESFCKDLFRGRRCFHFFTHGLKFSRLKSWYLTHPTFTTQANLTSRVTTSVSL